MGLKQYDTVVLAEPLAGFPAGTKGAIVEVYSTPYPAYDIEIVTNEGKTVALLDGVRPDQIRRLPSDQTDIRFASITIEANGSQAAVHFSDGTEIVVRADELYAPAT
jgi:hypothetical protein